MSQPAARPRCTATNWTDGVRCHRRTTDAEGRFCSQHNPAAKAAKRAQRQAEWEAKWATESEAEERQRALAAAEREVIAAAKGYWEADARVELWTGRRDSGAPLVRLLDAQRALFDALYRLTALEQPAQGGA